QPPLLTWLLQHNLGIKLIRQKSLAMERWHLSIPLSSSRKVTSRLPKATTGPLRAEAPAETFVWQQLPAVVEAARDAAPPSPAQPLPPISSATSSSSWQTAQGEGDSRPPPGLAEEDVASFFMTQVEDVSRPPLRPMAEGRLEERIGHRGEESSQAVPERYKGYEELLGGDTDPDFIKPIGIQQNVRALYYILEHPRVYRDATPRLDTLQKPYVPRKKHGRMLSAPTRKTRAEVLDGILMAMRNTSTITEVPLASVLQKRKSSPREYWEARRLMKEFQEVFKILPETLGEEMGKPLEEAQLVEDLLAEATPKQKSPKELPGKRVAKKVPKV
ncbi:PREDICTED: X-ray radiation resistance-associated protein 1, partial [Merops nubicus]|uniref:X-ray radiation resistance-associated protein 1 n=1 Tax=Merops nubicus TaxID=57421 RepID=UPI0004F02704